MSTQTVVETEIRLEPLATKDIHRRHEDTVQTTPGSLTSGPSPSIIIASSTQNQLPPSRIILMIATLSLTNFVSSISTGLLIVALPTIASSLSLPPTLLLWPQSVYTLTQGSVLLLAGSVADVVGDRRFYLIGCFLLAVFIFGCGLARTGQELIAFRAFQGVAVSLCLPTSVSILARNVRSGRARNVGYGCLGLSQPLGFCVGLVLAGVLIEGPGWRVGYYACGAFTLVLFFLCLFLLPAAREQPVRRDIIRRLAKEIDWVGAGLASGCLAMFSYVLAMITSSVSAIKDSTNIALLVVSGGLAIAFPFWVGRQERLGKPSLIPNSLWKNIAFTSTCLMLLASNAVIQTMELFSSLFFQQVQQLSAIQTSIRFLPSVLLGALMNFTTGIFVNKTPAVILIIGSSLLSAGAPLLMALINPGWPYWYDAFFAQLLLPLSIDVLFTVGIIIVSEIFPDDTQALAGGVFNTVAQLGCSIGLAVMGVISSSVTERSHFAEKTSPEALMVGYRASFWAAFALIVLACFLGAYGLRKLGKVGLKRD